MSGKVSKACKRQPYPLEAEDMGPIWTRGRRLAGQGRGRTRTSGGGMGMGGCRRRRHWHIRNRRLITVLLIEKSLDSLQATV